VSFDFKSFPKDRKGYDNVFVVVDRLGKRAFSLPCEKTVTAAQAAELYYTHIWRIYGTPETVTSDRGPQFVSAFTDELCKLTGVKQKLSTAYHPQTDGNTEVLNQYINQRLRPFVNHFQDNWSTLLPAMDFAQASLTHESTGISPFELEFGYKPRMHFDWKERTKKEQPRVSGSPAKRRRYSPPAPKMQCNGHEPI
jgi:transposase InsO family protein